MVFPNPVKDLLYLTSDNSDEKLITIYNVIGVPVIQSISNVMTETINVQRLPKGIYFYSICLKAGANSQGVFIKD